MLSTMHSFANLCSYDAQRIFDLVNTGEKIPAIKLARELTGSGLKEAKDFVEYFALNRDEVLSHLNGGKGFHYDPKKDDYIQIIISGAKEFTNEEDRMILQEDLENCPERLLRYIAFRFGKAI